MNLKILHISDIHGNLNLLYHACTSHKDFDIIVSTGDFLPNILNDGTNHGSKIEDMEYQLKFIRNSKTQNTIIKCLDNKPLVYVQGNHDWISLEYLNYNKLHELNNSEFNYKTNNNIIKFYGFPNTPYMNQWNHYTTEEQFTEIIDKIPVDTNILMTHCPPRNILDSTDSDPNQTDHFGILLLEDKIKKTKICLHMFGHCHHNDIITIDNKTYSNASNTYRLINFNTSTKKVNEFSNMKQYYLYLLPELSKLKNQGDAENFLKSVWYNQPDSNSIKKELDKLNIKTTVEETMEQFNEQSKIDDYINNLSIDNIITLTKLLSKKWRKNKSYDKLKKHQYWITRKIKTDNIYVMFAEPHPQVQKIFKRNHFKLSEIVKDNELYDEEPYSKYCNNTGNMIKYKTCLAEKTDNYTYVIFDGIHRAIQMASDKEQYIELCFPTNNNVI